MPVKFKRLTEEQFAERYPEALSDDREDIDFSSVTYADNPHGEVKVPGAGWRGCLIGRGKGVPVMFYDEDDGWQETPGATFQEIK